MTSQSHKEYYDASICKGFPRCGSRQASVDFGADTGFNYHPEPEAEQSCQCTRDESTQYSEAAPMAQYTAGQQVCLTYPAKNHVAETCTNENIPDRGMRIFRTTKGATTDPKLHQWPVEYHHKNGVHEEGKIDYKGFQNCPKFCEDPDKALCTVCFDLESNIATGSYTFHWEWHFNAGADYYSTCWEADVVGSDGDESETSQVPPEIVSEDSSEDSIIPEEPEESESEDDQVSVDENGEGIDFSVSKGKIQANGKPFHVKGVNWFGYEEVGEVLHGLWGEMTMDFALDFIQEHNFNAIRIPYAVETLLNNPIIPADRVSSQPELGGLRMIETMKVLVEKAAERNLLIMFDAHRLRPADGISDIWYDSLTSKADAKAAWAMLADTFCGSWNVFAADLKNEPHGEAEWGTGSPQDWHQGAEELGNFVQSQCPRWLIFVEGVSAHVKGYESVTGWWGGLLQGVRTDPVELNDNSKLVYSPHVYGPSVFMKPIFEDENYPKNLDAIWDEDFGFVPKETGHPIVIGEFGGFYDGLDHAWQNHVVKYIVRHNIGFFYWCLNPNSGDTGGLLSKDWKTPETEKLALLSKAKSTKISTLRSSSPEGSELPPP